MPNYRHSTCPYCPKTFRNAGPFDNHLRSSHPDQTNCFYNRRGGRQESPHNLSESQELYLKHNDLSYSSPEDLEENFSSDSEAESRFDDSSDELKDSPETATRCELYKDLGKTYPNMYCKTRWKKKRKSQSSDKMGLASYLARGNGASRGTSQRRGAGKAYPTL